MTVENNESVDFYRDPLETYGYDMTVRMAERGDISSQQSLGIHMLVGKGVRKDVEEAHRWLMMAAGNGSRLSQYVAGMHLVLGIGTEKS